MGTRLGAGMPKARVELGGTPLVVHAVRRIAVVDGVTHCVVVAPATHRAEFEQLLSEFPQVSVVDGGGERSDSVRAGLTALAGDYDVVLVHDAARSLAPPELFERVIAAVHDGADAVIPGLPVADTIKVVRADGGRDVVESTPNRASLRAVQTPQGFRRQALVGAHESGLDATDDAGLIELAGGQVVVIDGDPAAFKVTTAWDLETAERLLAKSVHEPRRNHG